MKKKLTLSPVLLLLMFTFFACSDLMEDIGRTGKVKKTILKEFTYLDRHYELTYNTDGNVTRVRGYDDVSEYSYNVTYIGTRIDSVTLVDGSDYISTNKNFVYDDECKIISFSNFLSIPDAPGVYYTFETPYTLEYDTRDRMISLNAVSYDAFTYDKKRNITTWTRSGNSQQVLTFTYDKGANPLNQVDNLFAILIEEPFYWEFLFSENNSVTRVTNNASKTTYTNVYDKRKRLIEKIGVTNGETTDRFSFVYY